MRRLAARPRRVPEDAGEAERTLPSAVALDAAPAGWQQHLAARLQSAPRACSSKSATDEHVAGGARVEAGRIDPDVPVVLERRAFEPHDQA